MDDCKARPRAGDPPKLDSTLDVLRELLQVERDRLKVALRIEDERSIVFPETTVIIRDIERLLEEIEKRETEGKVSPVTAFDFDSLKKRNGTTKQI